MGFTYHTATQQAVSDAYPHYLAFMENGPARIIHIWAVRLLPAPADPDDSERVNVENDAGTQFRINRRRLRQTVGEAIAALAADITEEQRISFESSCENGNRELFASMARMTANYVEAAIDAAWCQMKAERIAALPKEAEAINDQMLEVVRRYVEARLRPFGEHLQEQIERNARMHTENLFLVLTQRLDNVEGQLRFLAEILKPTNAELQAKIAKPKAAKSAKRKAVKRG